MPCTVSIAPVLAEQFFPAGDRMVSLLAAFGAFAVGFLMRPVGAIVFAVAAVGIVIRRNMDDVPGDDVPASPVRAAFSEHRLEVLRVVGLNLAPAARATILRSRGISWP